jgi:beta-lactamase class D
MRRTTALLAVLLPALAGAEDVAPDIAVNRIADGVWVHTTTRADGIPSNGLLVTTRDGLLLVDTPWTPDQTKRLVEWARTSLKQEVTRVVVTHSHEDRMGGLAAIPTVPSGALDLTVEKAKAAGGPVPQVLMRSEAKKLEDAYRGFVAFYPGPGHTVDNIVVYLPASRVLFGGCLVKAENAKDMGYTGEADLESWPRAIASVEERFSQATIVVPGHGPVGTRQALAHTRELLSRYAEKKPELGRHFEALGATGAVLVVEGPWGRRIEYGSERLKQGFLPASTFKIFNSLLALETGVIADEHVTFKWDGKDRGSAAWNRDHDLASAFQASAVWYYEELARRIGRERYAEWLAHVGYGNHDVTGDVDGFWIRGGLRITPEQQVDFLRRLYGRRLPFSARTMDTVVRIMKAEERDGATLYAKTGWTFALGPHHGWKVGWVDKDGKQTYFAIHIEAPPGRFDMRRAQREITENVLVELGAWPRAR